MRRLERALLVAALLVPAPALGCGWCTDAVLRRRWWQTSLALDLVVALGLEALLYAVFLLAIRRRSEYSRARTLFMAGVATVAVGFLTEASGFAMAVIFAVGLLTTFVRSLAADRGLGGRLIAARVALVLVVGAAGLFRSQPSQVKTPRLLLLAMLAPDSWGAKPAGWVEEQLVARPDAKAETEKLITQMPPQGGPRAQDVELMRLHQLVGAEPSVRAAICGRWGATGASEPSVELRHDRPGPPPGTVQRLCAEVR
jgi:hypothetical protein